MKIPIDQIVLTVTLVATLVTLIFTLFKLGDRQNDKQKLKNEEIVKQAIDELEKGKSLDSNWEVTRKHGVAIEQILKQLENIQRSLDTLLENRQTISILELQKTEGLLYLLDKLQGDKVAEGYSNNIKEAKLTLLQNKVVGKQVEEEK